MNLAASILSHRGAKLRHRRLFSLVTFLTLAALLLAPVQYRPAARSLQEPQNPDIQWNTDLRVDDPRLFINMTDRSLRYDTLGHPHIVYGGDHLYYATYNGVRWINVTVDASPSVGQYAALALDNNNRPRVSYYDAVQGALKFAYVNNLGEWVVTTVDKPPLAQQRATAAEETGPVEPGPRAWQDQGVNAYQTLAPDIKGLTGRGLFTSIAVDSNNRVYISYYDADNGDLKFQAWDGNTWFAETVDWRNDVGLWTSIAVGKDNNPRILYMSEHNDSLKYAECRDRGDGQCLGDDWSLYTVDDGLSASSETNLGPYASLALDKLNQPHVSYYDFQNGELRHGFKKNTVDPDDGVWNIEVIDNQNDVGGYTSIIVKENGESCISYFDFTDEDLKLACGPKFEPQVIASTGLVGRYSSLGYRFIESDNDDVDDIEYLGIVFLNNSQGILQYATPDDNDKDSDWEFQTIDVTRDVGISTSLTLNSNGIPSISYMDDMKDDLMVALGCFDLKPQLVDTNYSSGLWSSIEVDSKGRPHVFYYQIGKADEDGDLMYAHLDVLTGSWVTQVLDQNFDMGRYASTAISPNDVLHVAYYDASNGDLKYMRGYGKNWNKRVVDSEGDVGRYVSLALTPQGAGGLPQISYYDATEGNLKFAYNTATDVWNTVTIDKNGDTGLYTSLAINSQNLAYISYYNDTLKDLNVAMYTGSTWITQTVETEGDVGKYSSMAIDPNQRPNISYYDETNKDLKFAYFDGVNWQRQIVDFQGEVGMFSSLAISPTGLYYISYYDRTNGDLKLATNGGPTVGTCRSERYLPFIRK